MRLSTSHGSWVCHGAHSLNPNSLRMRSLHACRWHTPSWHHMDALVRDVWRLGGGPCVGMGARILSCLHAGEAVLSCAVPCCTVLCCVVLWHAARHRSRRSWRSCSLAAPMCAWRW